MRPVFNRIGKRTVGLSNEIEKRAKELDQVNKRVKGGIFTPPLVSEAQSVSRRTAKLFDKFCSKLSNDSEKFVSVCNTIITSATSIYNGKTGSAAAEAPDQIQILYATIVTTKNNVIGFRDAVRTSYGASAILNQSINKTTALLDNLIHGLDNFEQFLQMLMARAAIAPISPPNA